MASLPIAHHALVKKGVSESTKATFPQGKLKETSKVVDVAKLVDGRVALLLASTSFHPVDKSWPDQPADRGVIRMQDQSFPVLDCQIFGVHKGRQEIMDWTSVPKETRENWHSVVGHVIEGENLETWINQDVESEVDADHREALSLYHSASHLTAFAFNLSTCKFWKKEDRKDSLGSIDTDRAAIEKASIFSDKNEDQYRFGKSIQKKGLQVDALFAKMQEVEASINRIVDAWIKTGAKVEIAVEGPYLNSARKWRCQLPEDLAEMFCGGTHVTNLSVFAKVHYSLRILEASRDEKRLLATIEIERANR